jgi:hypothetical protein
MADAIYDFMAAGVPHSVAQVSVSDLEIESLGFPHGRVTLLNEVQCDQLRCKFEFHSRSETGVAAKLAVDLACLDARVAVLDLGSPPPVRQFQQVSVAGAGDAALWHNHKSSTAAASRFVFNAPNGVTATAIFYGSVDSLGLRHSAMASRSAKILCLEDRLWDVAGGAKFAAMAIDVAHAAGRKTMLVCHDSECVFRNRDSMRSVSDIGIDYLVGDSAAVLYLHGLSRLDSLVPRLRAASTKVILWRSSHAPLILEQEIASWTQAIGSISAAEFWRSFLPTCLRQIANDQQLHVLESIPS